MRHPEMNLMEPHYMATDRLEYHARQAWNLACRIDYIKPDALVIKFSPNNWAKRRYDDIIREAVSRGIRIRPLGR